MRYQSRTRWYWIGRYLPLLLGRRSKIPVCLLLPLPDASVDVVTAFSVFTYIECSRYHLADGIATHPAPRRGSVADHPRRANLARHWSDLALYESLSPDPTMPATPEGSAARECLAFRWDAERSYSAPVFYWVGTHPSYLGVYLAIRDEHPPASPIFPLAPDTDTAVGFRYATTGNNHGTWDVGNGTYAGSSTSLSMRIR